MERETRIRQQENGVSQQQQQQQQVDFSSMRRNLQQHSAPAGSPTTNGELLSSNTVDPFLSAPPAGGGGGSSNGAGSAGIPSPSAVPPSTLATDFHARQESADSGLGMGGSYSLPHTPEDFLASMDDTMDTTLDCKI